VFYPLQFLLEKGGGGGLLELLEAASLGGKKEVKILFSSYLSHKWKGGFLEGIRAYLLEEMKRYRALQMSPNFLS